MATYNGERYIYEQLESILQQLCSSDEIIISDNGSTDNTIDIILNFNDNRIVILNHNSGIKFSKPHYYISDNFHNALKFVSGDIVFLADQDDVWENNKVEKVIKYLENYDLVISNYSVINQFGEHKYFNFFKNSNFRKCVFLHCFNPVYHGCTIAFKSNMLDLVLPFPLKLILHDSWIGILISYFGRQIILENEYLVKYRRHHDNVSFFDKKSNNSLFFKAYYRCQLFIQLYHRIFLLKFKKV
jgi:glycosyltransferase involved in cell wall biosynthesis